MDTTRDKLAELNGEIRKMIELRLLLQEEIRQEQTDEILFEEVLQATTWTLEKWSDYLICLYADDASVFEGYDMGEWFADSLDVFHSVGVVQLGYVQGRVFLSGPPTEMKTFIFVQSLKVHTHNLAEEIERLEASLSAAKALAAKFEKESKQC